MTDDERELSPEPEDHLELPVISPEDDDDSLLSELEASAAPPVAAPPPLPSDDWMVGDIDAALAAVASLSEIMPQREAEAEARADARRSSPAFVPEMQIPPLVTLKRGRLGSLIPALLLIGIGAWLTLQTTGGTPSDPLLTAGVLGSAVVLSLLAQWLGSGRWSRGLLFFALLVLLLAGVVFLAFQPTGIDPQRGYPALIIAFGLAVVLAGLLARPVSVGVIIPGVLVIFGGVVGFAVTLGYIPADVLAAAVTVAPVVLVVVMVLLLLPLIFRRRRQTVASAE